MITVYTERQLPNNKVRRRYQVTLTDLQGNEHTQIVGMFNHDASDDGAQVEADLLASKQQSEISEYKESIRAGVNPFTKDSLWNTRVELLKSILDDALSLPATDPIVYNGLPYLDLVTDLELMAIYSKPQSWVDDVRAKALTLLSSKVGLDSYVPVIGGV